MSSGTLTAVAAPTPIAHAGPRPARERSSSATQTDAAARKRAFTALNATTLVGNAGITNDSSASSAG
jgi:hypothetical protein